MFMFILFKQGQCTLFNTGTIVYHVNGSDLAIQASRLMALTMLSCLYLSVCVGVEVVVMIVLTGTESF